MKWIEQVKYEPDINHFYIRCLGKCISYTDKPDGKPNYIFMTDFFDNYIVVKTSMTVRFTLMIASKKKDCD